MVKKINCLLTGIGGNSCCWCIDQCEFATDINFKSCEELSYFYKTLVETTYFTFRSHDIYSFFGRNAGKIHTFGKREIISGLRHMYQGYRIKFKINKAITKRYLASTPDIDTGKVPEKKTVDVSAPKERNGRRYSGVNLLSRKTMRILSTMTSWDFILNGFDNKNIRRRIYENNDNPKIINKTTRLLAKLKAHGIIKKMPRKNRYYLTSGNREITDTLLLFLSQIPRCRATGHDLVSPKEPSVPWQVSPQRGGVFDPRGRARMMQACLHILTLPSRE
ncbi:hypothetical protein D7V86_22705 [bacterium D16-51]|nr:hypothetical protein D7V96_22695 [bacterium D16-59]RKI54903.1 hypothetical protein D7V86_22705 [bacterium D16-51]